MSKKPNEPESWSEAVLGVETTDSDPAHYEQVYRKLVAKVRKAQRPNSLAEVLHHLADGGVVRYQPKVVNDAVNAVEFRYSNGFESRLPSQEWFPCATTLQLRLEGCELVEGGE